MAFAQQKVQFVGGPLDGEWRRLDLPLPMWFDAGPQGEQAVAQVRYGLVSEGHRQLYVLTQLLHTA